MTGRWDFRNLDHDEVAEAFDTVVSVVGDAEAGGARMSAVTQVNPVDAAREVLEHGYATYEGVLLDATTAHVILAVADGLSPASREKLEGMRLDRAAAVCWKLVSK